MQVQKIKMPFICMIYMSILLAKVMYMQNKCFATKVRLIKMHRNLFRKSLVYEIEKMLLMMNLMDTSLKFVKEQDFEA